MDRQKRGVLMNFQNHFFTKNIFIMTDFYLFRVSIKYPDIMYDVTQNYSLSYCMKYV